MDKEIEFATHRFAYLLDVIPAKVRAIQDTELYHQPAPGKWSKLEVLGHLVDSAANNWQRFVRIQFEDNLHLVYDQDKWNEYSYYSKMDKEHIINLWEVINRHLLMVIQNIPTDKLERTSTANSHEPLTMRFLIIDYIAHMEHHLEQILGKNY